MIYPEVKRSPIDELNNSLERIERDIEANNRRIQSLLEDVRTLTMNNQILYENKKNFTDTIKKLGANND